MERLDLGLYNGWVSFRAGLIKTGFFLFRFHRKKNPKKVLTGAERVRKFRAAHHTTADLRKLADKKLQRANSKLTISKLARAHERALGRARSQCFRDNEKLKKIITSAVEKIYFLR